MNWKKLQSRKLWGGAGVCTLISNSGADPNVIVWVLGAVAVAYLLAQGLADACGAEFTDDVEETNAG